ncbi:MAG: alginate export family protein [Candidatus Omnitrophota bacterium]
MNKAMLAFSILLAGSYSSAGIKFNDSLCFGGDILGEYFHSENLWDLSNGGGDVNNLLRAEAHLYLQVELDYNILLRASGEIDRELERVVIDPTSASHGLRGVEADGVEAYLEEAFFQIKNIAGGGFSFIAGRQFLNYGDNLAANDYNQWWGPGFIIADSLSNDPLLITQLGSYEIDPFDAVVIRHESEFTQIDAFYARSVENVWQPKGIGVNTELAGFYASYFGIENHQLDLYFTFNGENAPQAVTGMGGEKYIVGGRAAGDAADSLAYKIELAYQLNHADNAQLAWKQDADALGAQAGLNYHPVCKLSPNAGFIYTFLQQDGAEGTMNGFASPFEGKTYGIIAEGLMKTFDGINPFTNMHVFNLNGGVKPAEDLALSVDLYYFLLDEAIQRSGKKRDDGGLELDAQADYLITDNVRSFVGGGVYFPGKAAEEIYAGNDDDAYFLRAGIKVRF